MDTQSVDTLQAQGELCLLKGDLLGLDYFDRAAKLNPDCASLHFRQGLSLYEYGSEEGREKNLTLASRKFKQATALDPSHFDAWRIWGSTLLTLGTTFKEHHYFREAEEKLEKALDLSTGQPSDVLSELHWDRAVAWMHIADHSGEALDLQLALDAFQKASLGITDLPCEFWIDFGNTALLLARRINDVRLFVKAINCFKHAISCTVSSYEGWVSLAKALEMLYLTTHDEDHFLQANECFASAAQLRPQDGDIWLDWAKFLCLSGRYTQDIKRIRACIEKCGRAYSCDPQEPLVMAVWAEALALLGEISQRLDLLYEAQNKIAEAVELESDHPDIWYSYGMTLLSLGNYFSDIDTYFHAIEKLQTGLSIDRTCDHIWHAIATAYTLIGQLDGDMESLEKACRFYTKAIDLNPASFYLFDFALCLSKLGEMSEEQKWLEQAVHVFERALKIQKNAIYLHPEWLFQYACTLDSLGDFFEEDSYYVRAVEIFSHVLMIDPDFPHIHHRLGLAFSHLGELLHDTEHFFRAVHHFRLAAKHDEENDHIILDWGLTLINIGEHTSDSREADHYFREAEHKITQAAKWGNLQAYYHLSCLYSLLGQYEKSLRFLEKSQEFESLPPLDEILEDDWLENLRSTSGFREFLTQLEKKPTEKYER